MSKYIHLNSSVGEIFLYSVKIFFLNSTKIVYEMLSLYVMSK